jgi:hypothetical protein
MIGKLLFSITIHMIAWRREPTWKSKKTKEKLQRIEKVPIQGNFGYGKF